MPNNSKSSIDQLTAHVKKWLQSNLYEFDGSQWVAGSQDWFCSELGCSKSTLRKLIKCEQFTYDVIKSKADGSKITLLRMATAGPITPRTCAKFMVSIWKAEIKEFNQKKHIFDSHFADQFQANLDIFHKQLKKAQAESVQDKAALKKIKADIALESAKFHARKKKAAKAAEDATKTPTINAKQFGCLVGLAEVWGVEVAASILKYVIRNWPEFMVGVKFAITDLEADGKETYWRYYEFPSPTVIRKFNYVAIEMLEAELQKAKPVVAMKIAKEKKKGTELYAALAQQVLLSSAKKAAQTY